MKHKTAVQTSESFFVAAILAVVGGFMDAYSYICRGGVFANAETGNIVLLAISLASFQWLKALRYIVPITAFAVGVLISVVMREKKTAIPAVHWRQITVLLESLLLALVAFIPAELNLAANSIISLVCGVQVAAFAKFHGSAMATTMCTGNLRSGVQNLCHYSLTKDKTALISSLMYFGCIVWFIVGAMLGVLLINVLGMKAILFAAVGLWPVILLMFAEERRE